MEKASSRLILFSHFAAANTALTEEGWEWQGQDGRLGHLYQHADGRRARLAGGLAGWYEFNEVPNDMAAAPGRARG